MKILIIEKEASRQRQLRTILASMGHKSADIEICPDAKSALGLLKKRKFDIAFICISAPQNDELTLVREIRGGRFLASLPIVAYAPEVSREGVIEAKEAGVTSFLAYPFSVNDVEGVITQSVGKSSK
jgi:PleD family two-component response regulator